MSMIKLRLAIEISVLILVGCAVYNHEKSPNHTQSPINEKKTTQTITAKSVHPANKESLVRNNKKNYAVEQTRYLTRQQGNPEQGNIEVIARPAVIPVLVNKHNKLPDNYNPTDLVMTNIPFLSSATTERREMRRVAARAIAKLFAGARKQGVHLLGVSAYRSHALQESLFNYYSDEDGYKTASTYSAVPGTSEHETGLAIDVTGANDKCTLKDCFGATREGKWLQKHAADYGFIIRYPKGKEDVTGYEYEPWHLRFVGVSIARTIMRNGITLEEYYDTVPVNGNKQLMTFAH